MGAERVPLSGLERQNIEAAAFEEKIHYEVLVSDDVGGEALTKRIWVPDAVFASRSGLLGTLAVGDQVFINAYLLATTVFARGGTGIQSRFAASARRAPRRARSTSTTRSRPVRPSPAS